MAWRQNLNEGINDLIDATKTSKWDKYYNIVRTHFESESSEKFFNTEVLIKLLDDHRDGKADNSRKIWTVFIFLVWYKVYFENNGRY